MERGGGGGGQGGRREIHSGTMSVGRSAGLYRHDSVRVFGHAPVYDLRRSQSFIARAR